MTALGPGQVLFSFVRHWSRRPPGSDSSSAERGRLVLVVEAVHALSQRDTAATINEVAHEIGIDQSGASRLVTNAVHAGYLALRPSEDDARRRQALLTSAGHELLADAHAWQERVFDRLAQGWTQQRRDDFQQAMTDLIDHTHLLEL
ncbi:winged helix-turn-helix transcriptional regulator [Propionibacterium freudenreichii]|nr:MarR family transcriptional regulator [Propionibacterium freudenreichii]MDK9351461.1 winged helix-turn-helix transcriptional regulator [Propionibacterium freudenreichii]